MRFGILTLGDHLPDPHTQQYAETQAERHQLWVDLGVRAERGGFDSCWVGEHHFNDYIVSSPQMILAAIAARTEQIRLGTAVSLLANHDPVRFAEEFATLDLLSGGRAEIGLGSGITPHTYELLGQDPSSAHERMEEFLDLLLRLWREDSVDWEGKFRAPFPGGRVEPRTFGGGALPVNLAVGTSTETAIRAGREGHRLMLMTIYKRYQDFRPLAEAYLEAYEAAGHPPEERCIAAIAYIHTRRDGDAWDAWRPYVRNYLGFVAGIAKRQGLSRALQDVQVEAPKWLRPDGRREADVCGTPESVTEQLHEANRALGGVDRMLCYFDAGGLSAPAVRDSVDLFSEEVLPHFAAER